MDREMFYQQVQEQIGEYLSPELQKGNLEVVQFEMMGEQRCGFFVMFPDSGATVALDLENYYEDVCHGKSVCEVIKELAKDYEGILEGKGNRIQMPDKSDVAENFHIVALNYQMYTEVLQKVPYIRVHDIAIAAGILMENGESLPLTKELVRVFGMTEEEVLKKAFESHKKNLPPELIKFTEDAEPEGSATLEEVNIDPSEKAIYLLTNRLNSCASGLIGDKESLEKLAEKFEDSFYIIPNDMDTLTIIAKDTGVGMTELKRLVQENIRSTEEKDRLLSNNVYFYDADAKELKMYETGISLEKKSHKKNDIAR